MINELTIILKTLINCDCYHSDYRVFEASRKIGRQIEHERVDVIAWLQVQINALLLCEQYNVKVHVDFAVVV